MTGMVVFDWVARYPEAMAELAGWLRRRAAGRARARRRGRHRRLSDTLLKLFAGENTGKLVLALQ